MNRIRAFFAHVNRVFHPTPQVDKNSVNYTQDLIEDACQTVERVATKREEWEREMRTKPDIARALLLARDRE